MKLTLVKAKYYFPQIKNKTKQKEENRKVKNGN